jgi:hypothetical protein
MSAAPPMRPPPAPSSFAAGTPNGYDYDNQRFVQGQDGSYAPSNGGGDPSTGGRHIQDLTEEAKQRIANLGPMPVSPVLPSAYE